MIYAAELSPWLVRIVAFVFGAVWGSFFNVAIHRWPRGMSVVSPPSHCPACEAPIPWWRNVPIFGYLILRGRAACCGVRLSPRYALVEALSAVLCMALADIYVIRAPDEMLWHSAALLTLVYFAFVGALVIATFVDLEWMEIPDEVSLPGAALGLATAALRPEPGAAAAALGAGGGFLVVQLVFVWSYERLTGRRGMGEGDSKLLMMIGAFVGWRGALFALVAGAFQGLIASLFLYLGGRRDEAVPAPSDGEETDREAPPDASGVAEHGEPRAADGAEGDEQDEELDEHGDAPPRYFGHLKVPYGPFLSLGALEFLFFGEWIIEWYFEMFF